MCGTKRNTHEYGTGGEEQAAQYLTKHGYQILERNYRNRFGEIDLIARDHEYLVFVEVKKRANSRVGNPAEAVNVLKQKKISQAARYYLMCLGTTDVNCRFDVVSILGEEITLIQNAFYAVC